MSNTQHRCAAPGCGNLVDHDKLMCLGHWRAIPKHLQDDVWRTWRRVHRDRQAYQDARDAAIAHLATHDILAKQGKLL